MIEHRLRTTVEKTVERWTLEGCLVEYQVFRQNESYKICFCDFCQTSELYFQEIR